MVVDCLERCPIFILLSNQVAEVRRGSQGRAEPGQPAVFDDETFLHERPWDTRDRWDTRPGAAGMQETGVQAPARNRGGFCGAGPNIRLNVSLPSGIVAAPFVKDFSNQTVFITDRQSISIAMIPHVPILLSPGHIVRRNRIVPATNAGACWLTQLFSREFALGRAPEPCAAQSLAFVGKSHRRTDGGCR